MQAMDYNTKNAKIFDNPGIVKLKGIDAKSTPTVSNPQPSTSADAPNTQPMCSAQQKNQKSTQTDHIHDSSREMLDRLDAAIKAGYEKFASLQNDFNTIADYAKELRKTFGEHKIVYNSKCANRAIEQIPKCDDNRRQPVRRSQRFRTLSIAKMGADFSNE